MFLWRELPGGRTGSIRHALDKLEQSGSVVLALDRPDTLAGMEEAQLLDPGYTPEGDWADGPLLGLGFSLRLIRSLAAGCGGSLEIDRRRFLLTMPAVADGGESEAGQR